MMNKRAKKQDLAEKPQSVLAAALRYLDRRGYTAAELREKLLARGADAEAVEAAIARLIELRYLNERELVSQRIRSRKEFSRHGRSFVRQELLRRGADADTVAELLEEQYPAEDEHAIVRALLQKELPKLPAGAEWQERQKFAARFTRRMAAKGFSMGAIRNALNDFYAGEESFGDELLQDED
ncbi:MAG: regulatory protein RecX [Firmicutes bacterium]|nr:regulatory protein RecX [Bacillota bacterium]